MSVIRTGASIALASAMCLVFCAAVRADGDQDLVARAKDLYRTAAYDEALGVLNSIPLTSASVNPVEVSEYRVFCLLALDRTEEAQSAIAALVTANPLYQLSEAEASPRVRAIFTEVRRSVLPSVVQHAYAHAKSAYEKKDPHATAAFEGVLKLLQDPDMAGNQEFADLAVVVGAFRDLSAARDAASTRPEPAPPAAKVANRADENTARDESITPAGSVAPSPVDSDGQPHVIPPVAISQTIPAAVLSGKRVWSGVVEVRIGDTGQVLSARMATPITAAYDKELLQAASSWRYRPALKDGVPVPYVKTINIQVDTRPECSPVIATQCRPPAK